MAGRDHEDNDASIPDISGSSAPAGLPMPPSVVLVYATFPDLTAARATGRQLVDEGLARCVNILPAMTSIYVWQGTTETADETVLIAKVAARQADACVARIKALHTYDLPAILILPITGGFAPYLDWLAGRDDSDDVVC